MLFYGLNFQKILCPPERDGRLKTAKGSTNISGTIWSMCFISEDYNQPSKEYKPVLAIFLNRSLSAYALKNELFSYNLYKPSIQKSVVCVCCM